MVKIKQIKYYGSNIVDIGCGNSGTQLILKNWYKCNWNRSISYSNKIKQKEFPLIEYFIKDICSKNFNLKSKNLIICMLDFLSMLFRKARN